VNFDFRRDRPNLRALRCRAVASVVGLALGVGAAAGCRSKADVAPAPPPAVPRSEALQIDQDVHYGPTCPVPRIQIDDAGVHLSLYPSNGYLVRVDAAASPSAPPSLWDREIVPAPRRCPSVGRRAGRLDQAALTSLLRQVVAALPPCPKPPDDSHLPMLYAATMIHGVVTISASPNTPASELREAGEAAARAGLAQVQLRTYGEPPPNCTGAISPVDLHGLEIPLN